MLHVALKHQLQLSAWVSESSTNRILPPNLPSTSWPEEINSKSTIRYAISSRAPRHCQRRRGLPVWAFHTQLRWNSVLCDRITTGLASTPDTFARRHLPFPSAELPRGGGSPRCWPATEHHQCRRGRWLETLGTLCQPYAIGSISGEIRRPQGTKNNDRPGYRNIAAACDHRCETWSH